MPERRRLSAVLLLFAVATMPHLLWLAGHALEHHEHAGEPWSEHAQALVHGHEHGEEVPDHEHHLLPSPAFRPDPPQDLQAPAIASLKAPETEDVPLFSIRLWRDRTGSSSSSPPRLHLLCTLLI